MADRVIVRRITQTKVLIRNTAQGPKVIIRNKGLPGEPGDPGDSAYAVAVANGFVGSEQDWLDSLVGEPGTDGADALLGVPDGVYGDATNVPAITVAGGQITDITGVPITGGGTASGPGESGRVVLFGDGAPDAGLGIMGDSYVDRTTGNVYKKRWSKPVPWDWTAVESAQPDLATDAGLILAANEGSGGTAKELVSGDDLALNGGCTWAMQDGIPVIRMDGTGYLIPTAAVIGTSTVYTALVILRNAKPAPLVGAVDTAVYSETMDAGTGAPLADPDAGYCEPFFLNQTEGDGPDRTVLGTDTYAFATDPQELYTNTGPQDLSALTVLISRRNGIDQRLYVGGVELSAQPPDPDDNISVPSTKAQIGIACDDGVTFTRAGLIGDLAALIIWPTTALSDGRIAQLTANPFGVARQAGVVDEPGSWVLEAELATQAELDAVEAAAVTLPIAESDVTGLVSDLAAKASATHTHPESDVTNLVTDLAAKAPLASPALTGTPTGPTVAGSTDSTSKLATTAFVQAVATALSTALVNAAPSTLDTLKELADALGDDPNFAATLVTSLAGKQPIDATLTAIAGLTGATDKAVYFTNTDVAALYDLSSFGRTLAALADYAALRVGAGLVIGTNVQAYSANLAAFAALTLIADRLPYANGPGTLSLATFTAAARSIMDDATTDDILTTLSAAKLAGQLGGSVTSPDVRGLRETGGPTLLTMGAVADGEGMKRSGSNIIGFTVAAGISSLEPALFYSGRLI